MKLSALVLLAAVVNAKHEIYAGWKSYFVKPTTYEQLEKLGSMVLEFDLDFVSQAALDREGVVLVKPEYQVAFLNFLLEENILHWIHSEDLKVQFDIDDQKIEARKLLTRSTNGGRLPYDNYQTLEVIYEYMDKIAEQYPETVTLIQNTRSFEGRPLKYLKISKNNFGSNKPIIFIDAAIHGREWIGPPTVTYAIHKLVENVTEPDLLNKFDWILFPIVNPDGYEYSWKTQRAWRRTRSTDQHPLSQSCPGVDGNRNYGYLWNTIGTLPSPCTEFYAGSKPFSEAETSTVGAIINEYHERMVLFITMHSFGSMILYPWGHDGSLSEYGFALHTVGINMAEAIDNLSLPNFRNYTVGNSALVFFPAAGGAEDYAHYRGVPLTYTFELPGLSGGLQGFHLDPIYIQQICVETWAAISVGARMAGDMFGKK